MGEWVNLTDDLLKSIEEKLVLYVDKVRLSCICKRWQSALSKLPNQRDFQVPWLLLPCEDTTKSEASYGLFNTLDRKNYYLKDLPKNNINKSVRIKYRGSSCGWLVTVDDTGSICLTNPLTREEPVQLPSRSNFPDACYYHLTSKIILSSCPGKTNDYMAVAIYSHLDQLAYCKHGDEKWTALLPNYKGQFDDVIFSKGLLYALACDGKLVSINIGQFPQVTPIQERVVQPGTPLYLVESSSMGLLLVGRNTSVTKSSQPKREYDFKLLNFQVYKLDVSSSQWCKVTDIGDDVLFLGFNSSLSISSCDFPSLKRNSIYFTDDCSPQGTEIGVFDLESKSMEPLLGFDSKRDYLWPIPLWLTPNTNKTYCTKLDCLWHT